MCSSDLIGWREKRVPLTLEELVGVSEEREREREKCADCEVVSGCFDGGMRGLDGGVLTVGEIVLYDMVGEQFQELVTRKA